MTKLWKVTVNALGWDSPRTFYADSRATAEKIRSKFPASGPVEYAGNFNDENAEEYLENTFEYFRHDGTYLPGDKPPKGCRNHKILEAIYFISNDESAHKAIINGKTVHHRKADYYRDGDAVVRIKANDPVATVIATIMENGDIAKVEHLV